MAWIGTESTQHGATAADATDPPLPEEEETGEQEPEDHSTELLKRVLAGNRETDISRVKLAKMPAPTGFLGYYRRRKRGKTGSRSGSERGQT